MLKIFFAQRRRVRQASLCDVSLRVVLSAVFLSIAVLATPLLPARKAQAQQQTAAWSLGTSYAVGARVSYNNGAYKCLQAHTAQTLWEPPNAPSLWQPEAGTTTAVDGQPFPSRYFAPYVDVMLYPTFPLAQTAASTGVKHYTLAFITAAGNTCEAKWGGIIPLSDDFLVSDINNLRVQQGGNVIVSFGGATARVARHHADDRFERRFARSLHHVRRADALKLRAAE